MDCHQTIQPVSVYSYRHSYMCHDIVCVWGGGGGGSAGVVGLLASVSGVHFAFQ